ncbi:AAA family ATPase [Candidatus Bathyarchaeota archaeon]|nr:AAA family ATPase [Candidatus Bathyarchaeota archaeon]
MARLPPESISTGSHYFDRILGSGFPSGRLTLIYGQAGTGKTTLVMQCAVNCARLGFKTIFVDSDGTFSVARLSQIAYHDINVVSPLIILFTPKVFEEQTQIIEQLESFVTHQVALIAIDTITSLYRVRLGSQNDTFSLNRALNRQLAYLLQLARTHKIVIIVTSQVRSMFGNKIAEEQIEPVATRAVKFWAEIIVNLKSTQRPTVKEAVVEKYLSRESPKAKCRFALTDIGIKDAD